MKSRLSRSYSLRQPPIFSRFNPRMLGGSGFETTFEEARATTKERLKIVTCGQEWVHIVYCLWREPGECDLSDIEWLQVARRVMARIGAADVPWSAYLDESDFIERGKQCRVRLWISACLVRADGSRVKANSEFYGALNPDGSKQRWPE